MADAWERWVNREDHTVVYEARDAGAEGYAFRRPGGPDLGVMDRETWEAIYERKEADE